MRNDTGRPVAAACFGQRTEFPARGLHGGMTGRLREVLINGEKVHPKGTYLVAPGDTLTTLEAAGGGFGDPRVRVLAALTEDARNGFVSPDSARRNYGAEIDPETGEARRPQGFAKRFARSGPSCRGRRSYPKGKGRRCPNGCEKILDGTRQGPRRPGQHRTT